MKKPQKAIAVSAKKKPVKTPAKAAKKVTKAKVSPVLGKASKQLSKAKMGKLFRNKKQASSLVANCRELVTEDEANSWFSVMPFSLKIVAFAA